MKFIISHAGLQWLYLQAVILIKTNQPAIDAEIDQVRRFSSDTTYKNEEVNILIT